MTEATAKPPAIAVAKVSWIDGAPVSDCFDGHYFNGDHGLAESRHVFLDQNDLPARFSQLDGGSHFVVAECGFGTGLNFFATCQAWHHYAPSDATLHFVSFECSPLAADDFARACALWPELAPWYQPFLAHYPHAVEGLHRLRINDGRIRLSLFYGDASEGLQQTAFIADAWYLDGFAPEKNPSFWDNTLLSKIAWHSRHRTTIASCAAAESIRKGLECAGFDCTLLSGFGHNRETLHGPFLQNTPGTEPHSGSQIHGQSLTDAHSRQPVVIIGAGIAGALLARNLAERGVSVDVISQAETPADGASGNAQAAIYVKLGVDYGPETRFNLAALLYAQRYYDQTTHQCAQDDGSLANDNGFWHRTGLLQLATTPKEADRQTRFIQRSQYPATVLSPVTAQGASGLAQLALTSGGLWFPDSGWLDPVATCNWLLEHPRIQLRPDMSVTSISRCNANWCINFQNQPSETCRRLVIAAGSGTPALLPYGAGYRLKPIRGQITQVPENMIRTPACVVCGQGYLNPPHQGYTTLGATFDLSGSDCEVTETDHQENLAIPGSFQHQPRLVVSSDSRYLKGRASFRLTTYDYQPVAGDVPDVDSTDGSDSGLYVLSGFGSKGFALAPLLSEWLADRLTGQPECLTLTMSDRLQLARCRKPE